MPMVAHTLQQALRIYLQFAYPGGHYPPAALSKIDAITSLDPSADVPLNLFETDCANSVKSYAIRLGQPLYPHMKLVLDPIPVAGGGTSEDSFLLRVDTHDRHLHAAPGSPDAAWLTSIRASNKDLTEKIERAWREADLPTFKSFLKKQLEAQN